LNIFITGATGFVGCYLRKYLKSRGDSVWGTGYPEKPQESLQEKMFHLDIRSERDVFACIKEANPDWVVHLAAISNVRHSWEKRRETIETNVIGTSNLFEAIRCSAPRARVLFVSSSDVYGTELSSKKPLNEKAEVKTINPYAFTKLSGELLSDFYTRIENLDIVITRPFPHTGPGQSADFVCSDWAFQIARIEKGYEKSNIRVGDISVRRDFTDVRDVVRAYVLLLEKGKKGEIYNICSGKSYSLESILEMLLSFSSHSIEIQVDSQKLRKTEIPVLVGDNKKIKSELSWEPTVPIKQSLSELLDYWRLQV
jgi:GDP-4-dehydro-6-deoxy-D-mannose reductase